MNIACAIHEGGAITSPPPRQLESNVSQRELTWCHVVVAARNDARDYALIALERVLREELLPAALSVDAACETAG